MERRWGGIWSRTRTRDGVAGGCWLGGENGDGMGPGDWRERGNRDEAAGGTRRRQVWGNGARMGPGGLSARIRSLAEIRYNDYFVPL